MNILICRLQPWMAVRVAVNLSSRGHTVHSIDHGQLGEYVESGVFKSCHQWLPLESSGPELEYQFRQILVTYQIQLVVIAQKLWRYSNVAEKVCGEVGVKVVFTEFFFDDKLIFDDIGLQYTKENQSIGECELPIDWPKTDREPQPEYLSKFDLLNRLNLSDHKIVVVYGQVLWDMSLVESPEGMTYDEYIEGLCMNNPDTIFLFKPHPKDEQGHPNTGKYDYPNLIRVNASLQTLFEFTCHTAFSSTVIFEGVSRGLSFGSVGYHLLQGHTHSITKDGFKDIYTKILSYHPDMQAVLRSVSYLTNLYTMSMSDPLLADRLIHGIEAVHRRKR